MSNDAVNEILIQLEAIECKTGPFAETGKRIDDLLEQIEVLTAHLDPSCQY